MEKDFFTGNEAAEFLGIHPQTVKRWRKIGKLTPQVERPNLTLYSREYLEKIKLENNLE